MIFVEPEGEIVEIDMDSIDTLHVRPWVRDGQKLEKRALEIQTRYRNRIVIDDETLISDILAACHHRDVVR